MKLSLRTSLLIAVSAISLAACDTTPTQADLDNANATISELTGQVSSLTSEIAALDAQIAATQAALDAANASNEDMTAEIATLTAQMAELSDEKAQLEQQTAALQQRVANLTGENDDLTQALADAQAALDASDEDFVALQAELAALQTQYNDYSKSAFQAMAERTTYTRTATSSSATLAAAQASSDAAIAAQLARATAQQAVWNAAGYRVAGNPAIYGDPLAQIDPNAVLTLGQFYAQDPVSASIYASELGIDPIVNAADPVDITVWKPLNDQKKTILDGAVTDATHVLTSEQAAYNASFGGGITQQAITTLYDAAGNELHGEGAGVYSEDAGTIAVGDQVPLGAQITALYLMGGAQNAVIQDVLVWDASGPNPFSGLPVGAATYTSDNMVAYFAEQAADGTWTVANQGANAGNLSINFSTNSGALFIAGTAGNNLAANEYGIAANLTFDPTTGEFTGTGSQSYLAGIGQGTADTAAAVIEGNLWGAADTYTAEITATDTAVGLNGPVEITILTAIAGNGTVTSNLPPQ